MRIDTLTLRNFKKFANAALTLHPQYTLLVGENGSGKTSILDALAVALGVWLVEPPDSTLNMSKRNIAPSEIRLDVSETGDRAHYTEALPVLVSATGQIGDRRGLTWTREYRSAGRGPTNDGARNAVAIIRETYDKDQKGDNVLLPVIAYYGAGRAWLPSSQRTPRGKSDGPARRWAAFRGCLNQRIDVADLQTWFKNELLAARGGRMRPGFDVVRRAILACVPDASEVWFDPDRGQIALSVDGESQPLDNLSAGQRMMLALVADIAIKAVTQNNFLVQVAELDTPSSVLPRVLRETPGVVLIDELDVHLHPRWQRRVAADLKRTFPAIQFVCTTHSPQVIGEALPEEIRLLEPSSATELACEIPGQSFGMDSNWILQVLMGADEQDHEVKGDLRRVFGLIAEKQLQEADVVLQELRKRIGDSQGIQRAVSTIERIKVLGR